MSLGDTTVKSIGRQADALERIAANFARVAQAMNAACGPRVAEAPKGPPKCATCAAWIEYRGRGYGECRRRAPQQTPAFSDGKWPKTGDRQGCFDHIPKSAGGLPSGLPAHEAQ